MTTFDKAAFAMCVAMGDDPHREGFGRLPYPYIDGLRAALKEILPALNRHGDSGYVYFEDLQAILNDGEGE